MATKKLNPGTLVLVKGNVAGMIVFGFNSYHRKGITYRVMLSASDAFFRIEGDQNSPVNRRGDTSEDFLEDFSNLLYNEHPVILDVHDIDVKEFITDVDFENYDPMSDE